MADITMHKIIEFNDETGLKVSSKGEILDDLQYITKVAYGSDYAIEQGNEWYTFLDLLAGSLVEISGAIQKVYNTLSFVGASGTNLDNVVSFIGITRKAKKNSSVLIKATISEDSNIARPYSIPIGGITLTDYNGNYWTNIETLIVEDYKVGTQEPNYIGTAMFEATDENSDPTNVILQPYNDGHADTNLQPVGNSIPDGITFMNEVASELGNLEETDAQLRARYKKELYRNSVGTTDGLKAQINEKADVNYIYILENKSDDTINDPTDERDGMPPHSIWVIVDGTSSWDGQGGHSNDPEDIKIGETILNYKSLGCDTTFARDTYSSGSGTGAITVNIAIDSSEYAIQFSRANEIPCYVAVTLATDLPEGSQRDSIEYAIKENIVNYVNNLGISNDVLQSGLSSCVYDVILDNAYEDYVFDLDSITVGNSASPTAKRLSMKVNQYASITEENITITWEE